MTFAARISAPVFEPQPYSEWSFDWKGELCCMGCDGIIGPDHLCHTCSVAFTGLRPQVADEPVECLACGSDCGGRCDRIVDDRRSPVIF